ncbi:MAG: hypothetical protein ACXVXO_11890 [Mycobacteriaceae bacterium]
MQSLLFALIVGSPIWIPFCYFVWVCITEARSKDKDRCAHCGKPLTFVGHSPTEGMYSSYQTVWTCPDGHISRSGKRSFAEW